MMPVQDRFIQLLEGYKALTLNRAELTEFYSLVSNPACRSLLELRFDVDIREQGLEQLVTPEETDRVYNELWHTIHPARTHFLRTAWLKYAAAIIIMLGVGFYFWYAGTKPNQSILAKQRGEYNRNADIAPGGNKAILTLLDGSTIALDSAANGAVAQQGSTNIVKLANGQIVYRPGTKQLTSMVAYNTLTTPKGGLYQLTLPDGTRVWLNASSSITYPTAFARKERIVQITGEAYFEVVKDKTKPFIVKTRKDDINVLGTSFNINSYADEPVMKTTLLEGSVQINNKILKPGEAYRDGQIIKSDINKDIAWKNGMFNFQDAKLEEVMRQLSRWYGLEIIYEKGIPSIEFGGKIGRDLTLRQVLKALQSSEVHFTLEGNRRLIVKP